MLTRVKNTVLALPRALQYFVVFNLIFPVFAIFTWAGRDSSSWFFMGIHGALVLLPVLLTLSIFMRSIIVVPLYFLQCVAAVVYSLHVGRSCHDPDV